MFHELLTSSIILAEDWEALPEPKQEEVARCSDAEALLPVLVRHGLLTQYQADRVAGNKLFGLVLGNYRVLDRLGTGGMGEVFTAEHQLLRRIVAIKVLALSPERPKRVLRRFFSEMRAIARLQHPNIVGALEAGKVAVTDPDAPHLYYLVMEYVPGRDLEKSVQSNGPMDPAQACDVARQIAGALAEAHRHGLIHRDIKPSNILVTPEGQAKLLDFGIARRFCSRMTERGTVLGTMDYMAPEQARDASAVDIRTDLYGLGGTLYWCLTGRTPFPAKATLSLDLACRLTQAPPSVLASRPEVPAALDTVVARLLATDPNDRYATPQAVIQALRPFLRASPEGDRFKRLCIGA
jgi:serine/threonine protein kinase